MTLQRASSLLPKGILRQIKASINILDTTSAARVQAVVERVRMTLLPMLQSRNIEHNQSASLAQLASALSQHATKSIALGTALPLVSTSPVSTQNHAPADVKAPAPSKPPAPAKVAQPAPAPMPAPLRSSARLREYTATGLYPGENNCFLNALTQQIVTDPDMPTFLRQAAAFGATVSGDFKSFDRAETLALCVEFSRIVDALSKGNAVQTKDMSRLRVAMKLGGLRQEDCHEAFIKLTISCLDQLKHAANPLVKPVNASCYELSCRRSRPLKRTRRACCNLFVASSFSRSAPKPFSST